MISSNGSRNTIYWATVLIGLLPVWMIALPLDITNAPNGWQVFVRSHSIAVPLVQLIFVLVAMSGCFSPLKATKQLPYVTKIALALWIIISSAISFQPGKDHLLASIGLIKLAIAALFFLALVDLKQFYGFRFILTLWISLGIGATLYTLLWASHILVVSPQGDDWLYRLPGVNNVRHTGHFAFASVVAGLFSLIAFRDSKKAWLRFLLPLIFGSGGLGLALWTGSRGPLLASLVAMFVTFCTAPSNRKTLVVFFALSALTATAVVATLPVPHPQYGIASSTGIADVSAQGVSELSSGRTILWSDTIRKIMEHPVLGWGVNQYSTFGPVKTGNPFHPHNFPLQLMFSGGIVSVLLVLMIFLPALRRWKWPSAYGPNAAGVGGVIGILVYSMYDGALYFSYPIMIFLIAIATSIGSSTPRTNGDMSE